MLRFNNKYIAILHDILNIPIAWFAAYWLRFNLRAIDPYYLNMALENLPYVMIIQAASFMAFGLYRGVWRFASVPDLIRIIKAVVVGTIVMVPVLFFMTRLVGLPRAVIPLFAMLLIIQLGGMRFAFRWLKDRKLVKTTGKRVLIIGAGKDAEGLIRDLLRPSHTEYLPVAIIDERKESVGQAIQDIRIYGNLDEIQSLVKTLKIEVIIIALPKASAAVMRDVLQKCEATQLPVRTLPSMSDIASGKVSVNHLREIALEDLLGRDPVQIDWDAILKNLKDKVIMISGGGGSIGSELCRQVLRLQPKALVVIDNSEYHLFELEQELKANSGQTRLHFHLTDVCDKPGIQTMVKRYQPSCILHAAAYKHVPMLEPQIREAVRNNIIGTKNMAEAAADNHVEKFVLVSTDKAVNPSNVMGTSKRIAEIFCQNLDARSKTQFITVRFGNVLGSRGSVVEIFGKQLNRGGPLTVTHPDITRYFMTIPEATQLILQAMAMGSGGEIFVLDMGEPIKITYLAEQIIRLAGKRVNEDIKIEFTGLRSGEKLYEELFHEREALSKTEHDKILKAKSREVEWSTLMSILSKMDEACDHYAEDELFVLVKSLVPEFKSEQQASSTSNHLETLTQ